MAHLACSAGSLCASCLLSTGNRITGAPRALTITERNKYPQSRQFRLHQATMLHAAHGPLTTASGVIPDSPPEWQPPAQTPTGTPAPPEFQPPQPPALTPGEKPPQEYERPGRIAPPERPAQTPSKPSEPSPAPGTPAPPEFPQEPAEPKKPSTPPYQPDSPVPDTPYRPDIALPDSNTDAQ